MMMNNLIVAVSVSVVIATMIMSIFTVYKYYQLQVRLVKKNEELCNCHERLDDYKHILSTIKEEDVEMMNRDEYTMFVLKNKKKENKYVDLNYYKPL